VSSAEIESFRIRLDYELERLLETVAGLDEEGVNWKPAAPGMNSLLVLVTHALASAEDHVVRKAAGNPVVRDRDAEFMTTGPAAHLTTRAAEVRGRIAGALGELEGRLEEQREPSFRKWPVARSTVRDSLVHAIAHTAEHVGQAQLTRDLYLATRGRV
jgi:hypothetical protein